MSDEGYEARDFAYCGRTAGNKAGEVFHTVREILPDGTLGKERYFAERKEYRAWSPGGVYTGALFSEAGARGLPSARYSRQWPDRMDRLLWTSTDRAFEEDARARKMEKDTRKADEVAAMLLPVRRAYHSAMRRHDFGMMHALERAVDRALKTPPSTREE